MSAPAPNGSLGPARPAGLAPAAGPEPPPGFRLGGQLGAGASGEVWGALDPGGVPVALKFVDCRARDPAQVAHEVRLLRRLQQVEHPGFIRLRGVHARGRFLVLCLERAECSLADLHRRCLRETGRDVPPGRLLGLLGQAAAALDFLAGLRLAGLNEGSGPLQHCDVKPSNLLLLGETLKVADFGLCAGAGWRTQTGGFRGTPPYAAPELYEGRASPHTDQYALAVTFCELVAGSRPFRRLAAGPSYPGTPVDPMKLRPREAVVLNRALHPDPCRRWPSCVAFLAALREAVQAPRPAPGGKKR
jgi:serine/threonine protein kinase, bacterial